MNFFTYIKRIISIVFFSLFFHVSAYALPHYDKLIVFGDSLSDTGNVFALSKEGHDMYPDDVPIVPLSPPYYNGRFTNGKLWVEIVAERLHISETKNYAYGGAWAESMMDSQHLVPGLDFQVQKFLDQESGDHRKSDHLYVVWLGSNDYLGSLDRDDRQNIDEITTKTVNAIIEQMDLLHANGARHFLVMNLPDFSLTPMGRRIASEKISKLREMARVHNEKLSGALKQFESSHANVTIKTGDIWFNLAKLVANPESYGLKEVRQDCCRGYLPNSHLYETSLRDQFMLHQKDRSALKKIKLDVMNNPSLKIAFFNSKSFSEGKSSVCSNPDDYLFWDYIHPTAVAHKHVADIAMELFPS